MSDLDKNISEFQNEMQKSLQITNQLVQEKKFDGKSLQSDIPIKLEKKPQPSSQIQGRKIQDPNPFVNKKLNHSPQQTNNEQQNNNFQQRNLLQQMQTPLINPPSNVQNQIFPNTQPDFQTGMVHSACLQCKQNEIKNADIQRWIQLMQSDLKQQQQIFQTQQKEIKHLQIQNHELQLDHNQKQNNFKTNIQQLQLELNSSKSQVIISTDHLQMIEDLKSKLQKKNHHSEKQCKKIRDIENTLAQANMHLEKLVQENTHFKKNQSKFEQDNQLKVQQQSNQIKELKQKLEQQNHLMELDRNKYIQMENELQNQIQQQENLILLQKNDVDQKDMKLQTLKAKKNEAKIALDFESSSNQQKVQFLVQESIQNKELIASLQGENNSLQEKVLYQDQEIQELRKLRSLSNQSSLIEQIKSELREKKDELEQLREKYEHFLQGNFLKIQQEQTKVINQPPIYIEKEKPIYVDKPVYIEKVVYKDVPVEKIIEKPIYIDKKVEVPIYIDKVIEKPVYIEVEKLVERDSKNEQQEQMFLQKIQNLVDQNKSKIDEIKNLRLRINELEFQERQRMSFDNNENCSFAPQQPANNFVPFSRGQTRQRSPSPIHYQVPVFQPQPVQVSPYSVRDIQNEMNQMKSQVFAQNLKYQQ